MKHKLSTYLRQLEAESIHIIREVVAEFDNPVMLYSIGKDSSVMLHLAHEGVLSGQAAVSAAACRHDLEVPRDDRLPRPRGEAARARPDRPHQRARRARRHLSDHPRQRALHRHHEDAGAASRRSTSTASTRPSAARAATRRSRAPRSASSPSATPQHRWDPKNQRPELWHLYNTQSKPGESIRVFPLSNWTELDIWQYIHLENIPIVPLYFAAERPVVERDGMLIMVDDDRMPLRSRREARDATRALPHARLLSADRRHRIRRRHAARDHRRRWSRRASSERQGRVIDHDQAGSMEKKKQEGLFLMQRLSLVEQLMRRDASTTISRA